MQHTVLDPVRTRMDEIAAIAADLFCVTTEEIFAAESFVDDTDADSLLAIELLSRLEKRYGVTIPETSLIRIVNLRETYAVVAESAGW
ncbi:acyl carrier protein [Actinophytocola oryzae]|uniref:Acyl carrier protein n=1 Tax=Actinophytocola oryzae TaxID=502181 RepID=A0A4R7VYS0_9PSEU|nr:acyl carrier protein [Actinophytocola oryzae]TDV54808.1 acyl carrier protein [Actinophytocola oryzae]